MTAWCNINFGTNGNPLLYAHHLYLNSKEITDLIIPNSVTNICSGAFEGCSSLNSLTIPNNVISIGGGAFWKCSGLINLTIPNSVTRIGGGAFSDCSGLITVTMPNCITSIESNVFFNCSNLTSVTIPNGVTYIGLNAFSGCISLTSITLGESIERIDYNSFGYCSEITDVYCLAKKVPIAPAAAFENSYIEYATLHVPAESLEAYKNTEPWKLFMEIVPLDDSEISETSISNNVLEKKQNAQIYDIYGRRLSKPSKGVNIIDGKKVFIK